MAVGRWLYSQFIFTPPVPTHDFSGQTIIVTGGNNGLGLEAAKHFVRLNAKEVIITVRSVEKGEAALKAIENATNRPNVAQYRPLDMSSYASVKAFATDITALKRIDTVILNAGMASNQYSSAEDNESTLTVNVISTTLLTLLLLPILRKSAQTNQLSPKLCIVSSDTHSWTTFPEQDSNNIFDTLNNKDMANMEDRYQVSKLLSIYATLHIAKATSQTNPLVAINMISPGLAKSGLGDNLTGITGFRMKIVKTIAARSTEVGSRTLVHAATVVGPEIHGQYLGDCDVANDRLSPLVTGPKGELLEKKIWIELEKKLEGIQPGVTRVLDG